MSRAARAIEAIRSTELGPEGLNAFLSIAEGVGPDRVPSPGDAGTAGGSLVGEPVAVKDNIATADLPTTCGSRVLEGYRSPFEATAVRRLRAAGATVVGKTNLDEFGMGSSTEASAYGPTLNPHDRGRVPGGSSGGSAAAVAAGYVRMALGSDTGGSVRQPAAFCGVVGFKPTYGRVSRYGLVSYASSFDQIGGLGRTVRDAARLVAAVAGHDPRDATSVPAAVPDWVGALGSGVKGRVVGVPEEYLPDSLDPGVRAGVDDAVAALRAAGAEIRSVSLPHTELAIPAYYVLAPAEASSNLARYDGVRFGVREDGDDLAEMYAATRSRLLGTEVKRRIMLGTYVLSAGYHDRYYATAQRVRSLVVRDFRRVFDEGVDLLITPTTPGPAFRLGERLQDPMEMYLSDVFTVTANLAGLPALSVPVGRVDGLPIGGQLLAPWWAEGTMLAAAVVIEEALGAVPAAPMAEGGG